MFKQDIPLYKLDLTGKDHLNLVPQEYRSRTEVKNNHIFVPNHAPFYQESFELYHPNGELMVEGEDYEFYGIMTQLTKFTSKSVGLYVRLLKDSITEWYSSYQVVGNFNKLTNEILLMLKDLDQDDRQIHWDNISDKPTWWVPELHQHDWTYDISGFEDLVNILTDVAEMQATFNSNFTISMDAFNARLDRYILGYKKVVMDILANHAGSKNNNHGVNKAGIGLPLVDNYGTANFDETLLGESDQLRITPFNAARVASLASGRNTRLFPAGSLPILRYGNDTFIPPTIQGSFEGQGGYNFRGCVNKESSGAMLILQHRNNGVTRGLYFLASNNAESPTPEWIFTGYRYQHPTATADGANLDTVINGSGRRIMVVGDALKNIWYWCETHGTLNPARHTLIKIKGEFLARGPDHHQYDTLIVNEDYKSQFFILSGQNHAQVTALRPGWPSAGSTGNGDRSIEGYVFYVCVNGGDTFNTTTVSFTENSGVTIASPLFLPYVRKMGSGATAGRIIEFDATFTTPVTTVYFYRGVYVQSMKMSAPNQYAFKLHQYVYSVSADTGLGMARQIEWKGTLEYNPVNNILKITRGPGEKLYRMDPSQPIGNDVEEHVEYRKWKLSYHNFVNEPAIGQVEYNVNNWLMVIEPVTSGVLPCRVRIYQPNTKKTPELLIGPVEDFHHIFTSAYIVPEINPAGYATGFSDPVVILADTTRPETGTVLSRQTRVSNQQMVHEMIGRKMPFLLADWTVDNSIVQSMTLGGTVISTFPLTPETVKTDHGPGGVWCNHGFSSTPANSAAVRERFTRLKGADGTGNINGIPGVPGDWLFASVVKNTLVNNKVTIQPTLVYHMQDVIMNQIKPYLQGKGWHTKYIADAWTCATVYNRAGVEGLMILVTERAEGSGPQPVKSAIFVGTLTGTGTPTTVNGYTFYQNSTFNFGNRHSENTPLGSALANAGPMASLGHRSGQCITETNIGTSPASQNTTLAVIRSLHKYAIVGDTASVTIIVEFNNDWSITRTTPFYEATTPYGTSITFIPGWTMGRISNSNAELARGAALVGTAYLTSGSASKYDAVVGDILDNTRQRMIFSNLLVSQYVVYFQMANGVILAGRAYDIPGTFIDIRDIDSNPAGKTFYVYLTYLAGEAIYQISSDVRPETPAQSMIAKVVCGTTQIDNIIPYNRFTLDSAIISDARQGSAILTTGGSVFEIGNTSMIFDPATDLVP